MDIIIEADRSNDSRVAIYCKGMCQGWLHRGCAGLSKASFNVVKDLSEPYYCPHCFLSDQKKEIASLKDAVQHRPAGPGMPRQCPGTFQHHVHN